MSLYNTSPQGFVFGNIDLPLKGDNLVVLPPPWLVLLQGPFNRRILSGIVLPDCIQLTLGWVEYHCRMSEHLFQENSLVGIIIPSFVKLVCPRQYVRLSHQGPRFVN